MNLDEFKAHVTKQREASKAEALAILSNTLPNKESKWYNDNYEHR